MSLVQYGSDSEADSGDDAQSHAPAQRACVQFVIYIIQSMNYCEERVSRLMTEIICPCTMNLNWIYRIRNMGRHPNE